MRNKANLVAAAETVARKNNGKILCYCLRESEREGGFNYSPASNMFPPSLSSTSD